MIYQALYDYVSTMDNDYLIFDRQKYPENIVIPAVGYAIPLSTAATSTDGQGWDTKLTWALSRLTTAYLFIKRMKHPTNEGSFVYYIGPTMVFNDKAYAMGFIHGFNFGSVYGEQSVIDLITGQVIRRK
jgi:hypothetical protein